MKYSLFSKQPYKAIMIAKSRNELFFWADRHLQRDYFSFYRGRNGHIFLSVDGAPHRRVKLHELFAHDYLISECRKS